MKYSEAKQLLNNGERLRISSWSKGFYCQMVDGKISFFIRDGEMMCPREWSLTQEAESSDWEIYQSPCVNKISSEQNKGKDTLSTYYTNRDLGEGKKEKQYPHSEIVKFLDRVRIDIMQSEKFKSCAIDVDELANIINKHLGGHFKFNKIL